MLFEIINDKNKVIMHCSEISCIPSKQELKSMSVEAGYKFKINGKRVAVKQIDKMLEEIKNGYKD